MLHLLAAAALAAQPAPAELAPLMSLYRELHAAPELAMAESRTAARLAPELRKLGYDVTEKVGGTGIVAILRNGPGKTVLLRADMDGLPLEEKTGLPFASKVRTTARSGVETGVTHACAHDTHMTALIGTARRLASSRSRWKGTIVLILQPGEETSEGAAAMLADGLFTRFPRPDTMLAFHNSASLPAGTIGLTPGPALANVDSVDILVRGVGSHGAAPQNGRDPIVLAARIVSTVQTLVSRERNPFDPAVVTVGSFHAGTTHNIIPDEAKLQITVRSYTPEVRQSLLDGIRRVARGEAIAAGIPDERMPLVTVRDPSTPATVNSEDLTAKTRTLFTGIFGADRVRMVPAAMVGEDFSRYLIANPQGRSLLFWVGGVPQAKWDEAKGETTKLPGLHSPYWAPDAETVIGTAVQAMEAAALAALR
ncbi:amidohydrolase [Sphingomonas sp. LHG3406-1]|uniref:amidohydrolase n=1 Tax=Sphingomonas sp. LHG3406-1 TaxID=2804617 RepID=UPI002634109B|nr:amidohydrolase [Sphingomonas sp. LHG3406-1]